jgi:hypothetical protein
VSENSGSDLDDVKDKEVLEIDIDDIESADSIFSHEDYEEVKINSNNIPQDNN